MTAPLDGASAPLAAWPEPTTKASNAPRTVKGFLRLMGWEGEGIKGARRIVGWAYLSAAGWDGGADRTVNQS